MTCSQLSRLNSGHLQTDQVGNVYGQPGPCCGAEVMCSSVERLLGIFFACCRKIRMDGMLLGPVISWSASDVHEHWPTRTNRGHVGIAWNRRFPNHPLQWDFPFKTIYFGVPPFMKPPMIQHRDFSPMDWLVLKAGGRHGLQHHTQVIIVGMHLWFRKHILHFLSLTWIPLWNLRATWVNLCFSW